MTRGGSGADPGEQHQGAISRGELGADPETDPGWVQGGIQTQVQDHSSPWVFVGQIRGIWALLNEPSVSHGQSAGTSWGDTGISVYTCE